MYNFLLSIVAIGVLVAPWQFASFAVFANLATILAQ